MPSNQPKHIIIDARIRQSSTGRYVDRLLEHLQTADTVNRYSVLLKPGDSWQSRSKRFTPVVCRFAGFSFNPINQLLFSLQLFRLRPNLVHFAMSGFQPIFYFGRQVTTTHDLTMYSFTRRGRLPRWVHYLRMKGYRLLMWQAHRKAKAIIVPSEYVRDALAKFHLFTNRKIAITYEASEPPLRAKPRKPEYIRGEFVMHLGSAFPHKNLRRLVKAFALVKEKHPNLYLVIAGKKEYHARKLERWIARHSQDHVIMPGFVDDNELKWLYENAEAYVFPSLSEGFGLPGLEAMTHGCPVASSNATCLPEIYEDAAIYFDPENIEDIAASINKLISNEDLRKKLIKAGNKRIDKFSWSVMAEQTLAVYESVLS